MLTNEELTKAKQKIAGLKTAKLNKTKERQEMLTFVEESVCHWLLGLSDASSMKIKFSYDNDYNFKVEPYEKIRYARISIAQINEVNAPAFDYFDMKVYDDKVEYSHCSGRFDTNDIQIKLAFMLMSKLFLHEDELKQHCFEMHDKYLAIEDKYYEISAKLRYEESVITQHENEVKRSAAIEKLKESVLFEDHAGENWYLKVVKITDKTVKCDTYYDSYSYTDDFKEKKLHKQGSRNIKLDDFISRIVDEYYVVSDKEVK